MLFFLRPQQTYSKIEDINLVHLSDDLKIKGLIFDFDGTIKRNRTVSDGTIEFIKHARKLGFKISIVSNNFYISKQILRKLRIRAVSRFALKPLVFPYKSMAKQIGLKPEQVAFIGNTHITDIWGANLANMYSIYIQVFMHVLFIGLTFYY